MTALITSKGLTKNYGKSVVVDNLNFEIEPGRIVGLVGPNGAGKSTTLKAILGLIRYRGTLEVLGQDPRTERKNIMREMSYIADIASLPGWIRVDRLLQFMQATHPSFDKAKTLDFLSRTDIPPRHSVKQLSKGMKTQLHLAIVMGINAKLLILDEPTLGLDIIYRSDFYTQLLNEYFDEQRTILITTHQIEEVEHILTDLMFINRGKLALNMPTDEIGDHFIQLRTGRNEAEEARKFQPIYETQQMSDSLMVFRDVDAEILREYGEIRRPSLSDLFIACVKGEQYE